MKPHFSPPLISTTLALAAVVSFVLFTHHSSALAAANSAESDPAPAWELRNVDGSTLKSDQFAGKVVIVDFWATWCPPCREEIPGFVDLHRRYADKGLVVVGVALDRTGPSAIKAFMEKFGMKYPVVIGDARTVEAFGGVEAIPTTFVIDRAGKIVGKHVGYEDRETFEKEIKRLL